MEYFQSIYQNNQWQPSLEPLKDSQLVLAFGNPAFAKDPALQSELKANFPNADIIGCTTSGEILNDCLYSDSLTITAINFQKSSIKTASASVIDHTLSGAVDNLLTQIPTNQLRHVLVFSDGQHVNGTELVNEMKNTLPESVMLTGGLAGDNTRFEETVVWHNDKICSGQIVVCGLYGDNLDIGHGSVGGWVPFGPERIVTASESNVLYELDGSPALSLYKKYLGDAAKELPSSALLFPLAVKRSDGDIPVTRTILNIDEEKGSMIFAGDIPKGAKVQLMHANLDKIVDGAEEAAEKALSVKIKEKKHGLILLVSCVGRRLVLGERTEDELEVVTDIFGKNCAYTGFYSYGEISPVKSSSTCDLHNQTMTITAIFE